MTPQQKTAIDNPCLLAEEAADERYRRIFRNLSVIITVNSGDE